MKESIQSKQHQLFKDAGAFLNWWLEKPRLTGRSQRILKNYYCNYEGRFAGYLKWAWADRHFELDRELEAQALSALLHPRPDHELIRDPVERGVDLHGREELGVVREPISLPGRQVGRVEPPDPVVV